MMTHRLSRLMPHAALGVIPVGHGCRCLISNWNQLKYSRRKLCREQTHQVGSLGREATTPHDVSLGKRPSLVSNRNKWSDFTQRRL
ncbi:hypothetical protein HD806DRAFT_513787 [Xylariaceae sp. AK1471]|nr:hypothetical protein HD806DRAFT_513787 [Xylariaceae sp. AK1471]